MDARILAVDDDPDVLKTIVKALGKSGYRIDKAENVGKAIELLKADDYDIVITDKNLNGLETESGSGMAILKYLRDCGSRTEAIMITGYATIETAIEAMRLGAFDYIFKPFSLEVLRTKVERILELRRFLNPENAIKSFKEFHNELLNMFENPERVIDPAADQAIKSILTKVEYFFRVQKEREKIMLEQREALAEISSAAEELRDTFSDRGISHELLEKICNVSSRRL
jgi:DNA-binding NtrC family response regulator